MRGPFRGVLIGVAVLAAAACSSGASPTATSTARAATASASATAAAAATQPETAAAAKSLARQYFGLYSASQFAASYGLLAPSAQQAVSETTWVAVHQGCPARSAGLAYTISKATLTGNTAIVTVSLAGAAASLGSVSQAR